MTDQNNAAQAIQEGERNAAADQYFKARAWVMDTNDNRRIFEAGFDRAYALLSKLRAEGVQAGDDWPARWEKMRHEANEWADMAINGLQWVRNIQDGTSTADAALANLNTNLAHCRATQALASAPVAGEAVTMKEICPDCGHQFQCFHNPYINQLRAAPQASEAVRKEALYLLREARALLPMFATDEAIGNWSEKVNRFAAGDVIDIPLQADKDGAVDESPNLQGIPVDRSADLQGGGDCAKGAGENLLDYAMAIAHERELDVLGHKHNSDEAVDRFKAAVERALSPTPSVVKQSLTATQTGEKGESE